MVAVSLQFDAKIGGSERKVRGYIRKLMRARKLCMNHSSRIHNVSVAKRAAARIAEAAVANGVDIVRRGLERGAVVALETAEQKAVLRVVHVKLNLRHDAADSHLSLKEHAYDPQLFG